MKLRSRTAVQFVFELGGAITFLFSSGVNLYFSKISLNTVSSIPLLLLRLPCLFLQIVIMGKLPTWCKRAQWVEIFLGRLIPLAECFTRPSLKPIHLCTNIQHALAYFKHCCRRMCANQPYWSRACNIFRSTVFSLFGLTSHHSCANHQ